MDNRVYERNLILELKEIRVPNLCKIATFHFKKKSFFSFNNKHFVIALDK